MKKIKLYAVVGVLSAIMFVGCATNSGMDTSSAKEKTAKEKAAKQKKTKKQKFDQTSYDNAAKTGDYLTCLGMIASDQEANPKKPRFELAIDQGLGFYFSGDYETSATKLDAVDVDMQAGSEGKNYWPSLFEAYTMEAVAALSEYNRAENQDDGLENAMVKMRRLAEIQAMWDEYRAEIEAAEKSSEDPNSKEGKDLSAASQILGIDLAKIENTKPAKGKLGDRYSDSEFARLMSVCFRSAYDDNDKKFDIQFIKNQKVAEEAEAVVSIPYGSGRVEVFALSGTIAQKTPQINEFPGVDPSGRPISLTLPLVDDNGTIFDTFPLRFRFRWPGLEKDASGKVKSNSSISKVIVSVDGEEMDAILVENFNESLRMDVDYFARPNYSKNVAAVIAAKSSAAAGGMVTLSASYVFAKNAAANGLPPAVAMAGYLKAKDALAAAIDNVDMNISPNCEQVKLMPEKAYVAGFNVPAGSHEVTISYLGKDGNVLFSETKTIDVASGRPSIVESHCEK